MIDPTLAKRIRLVGFDIDGTMTDGGIYLGTAGSAPIEFKRYDIQDGVGIHLLRDAGIFVAIVTGRVSEGVRLRALELEADDLAQDPDANKLAPFLEILERRGIPLSDAAFVGDDIPDYSIMQRVGLPVAVGNALPEVRALAKVQLERRGGFGAIREFIELLLKARGEWDATVKQYVAKRSRVPERVR